MKKTTRRRHQGRTSAFSQRRFARSVDSCQQARRSYPHAKNAAGPNDGAAELIITSEVSGQEIRPPHSPSAYPHRFWGICTAPVKPCEWLGIPKRDLDLPNFNKPFASCVAMFRQFGIAKDAQRQSQQSINCARPPVTHISCPHPVHRRAGDFPQCCSLCIGDHLR
jgi:hypothetical protein